MSSESKVRVQILILYNEKVAHMGTIAESDLRREWMCDVSSSGPGTDESLFTSSDENKN